MKKYCAVFFVVLALVISGMTISVSAKEKSKKTTVEQKDDDKDKLLKKKAKKSAKDKDDDKDKKEYKKVKHNKEANESEIGEDEKGRMIYEGPRGGHYYYTDHGTKVYIKQDK